MTEMVIQQLLIDADAEDVDQGLVEVEPRGLEVAADWRTLRSPDTYTGYGQATGFASEDVAVFDKPREYAARPRLLLNYWDLSGTWTVGRHAATLNESGGRIAFQFQARDVNLVMGPTVKGASVPFRVYLDGQVAEGATGTDVQPDGRGVVNHQRTYQLIHQTGPIEEPRFEIEFLDAGVEAYCFTGRPGSCRSRRRSSRARSLLRLALPLRMSGGRNCMHGHRRARRPRPTPRQGRGSMRQIRCADLQCRASTRRRAMRGKDVRLAVRREPRRCRPGRCRP